MATKKRYAGSIEQGMQDLAGTADPASETGDITTPQGYVNFYGGSSFKVRTQRLSTSQGKRSRRIGTINSSQNTNPTAFDA